MKTCLCRGTGWRLVVVLPFAVVALASCGTNDWHGERVGQTAGFLEKVDALTDAELAGRGPLRLEDCIEIALRNNLAPRRAEIERRIARLDRRVSFANFLPKLELKLKHLSWGRQPETVALGMFSSPIQDQHARDATVQMQLPIFVPATWYAYAMHRRGEDIADLVVLHARQLVSLQTTAMYFHCVALEESAAALESQVAAANALLSQVAAFRDEGLVSEWQREQAEVLVLVRETELAQTRRSRHQAASDLLAAMGLSPLSGLSLDVEQALVAPAGSMAELVLQALLENPKLHAADRMGAINRLKIKLAIAEFLPKLIGFASRTSTSDSFITYPDFTLMGLNGVMSLFNGFANVNGYRAARERARSAYYEREQLCFTIMTEVVRAHLNLENAASIRRLAAKALSVAQARLDEVDLRWQEGLIDVATRFEAVAERDRAEMMRTNAGFQEQVAIASLRMVLGSPYMGLREGQAEGEAVCSDEGNLGIPVSGETVEESGDVSSSGL